MLSETVIQLKNITRKLLQQQTHTPSPHNPTNPQMQQQKIGHKLNLTYHPKLQQQKNYLLKVDKQFLQELANTQQLIIEGDADDELVLNTNDKSYKIKGINISTTLLIVDEGGTIVKQTGSYLDVQKFSPHFWEIYDRIASVSLKTPDRQVDEGMDFQGLVENYGFTEYSVRKQCFLGEQDWGRLSKAMNLVKISQHMGEENQNYFIYISLQFSVWIMRKILQIYNQAHRNLFQPLEIQTILSSIQMINIDILNHITHSYKLEPTSIIIQEHQKKALKLTQASIIRYIINQMKLAKNQYTCITFDEVLDEMLLIYMPAQVQINSNLMRAKGNKDMEEMYCYRFQQFIDVKGENYVGYDYMAIDTDINARLKFLSGFKNRWNIAELRAIFRGIDSTENGKFLTLQDILLKKFRKYGQEYQIKFILPTK